METVLALFAHDRLGIHTYGFGPLLTAEAVGGLLGAGIASSLGRRLGIGTALTCTAAVEGLAILGLAAAPNPYAAGLSLAVCGAGMGATMVLGPSLRQAIVPARLMGRVASTSRMLAMCAAPVGAFLGGWLATTYDIRTPLYAAAALLLAMTAVTASMTSNRRVEAALRAAPSRRRRPTWCDACRDGPPGPHARQPRRAAQDARRLPTRSPTRDDPAPARGADHCGRKVTWGAPVRGWMVTSLSTPYTSARRWGVRMSAGGPEALTFPSHST